MERSGMDIFDLSHRFSKLPQWLTAEIAPTLKQLENFAKATHTPIGMLMLPTPPLEVLPIPDFRTVSDQGVTRPSVNLLDTIYLCQQRQSWYQDYTRNQGMGILSFAGSVTTTDSVPAVAETIRQTLNFSVEDRSTMGSWEDALRQFIINAESAGILVMRNGIVLNNTRRKLNPQEFRGFALASDSAPLIFINGADSKAAQMFTLAHELAHIWLGETGVSNPEVSVSTNRETEKWCNAVAAELLVPKVLFKTALKEAGENVALSILARKFKVSSLVILRRMLDVGFITRPEFFARYEQELQRLKELSNSKSTGGDFYRAQPTKISRRFAKAIVANTLEGQTLYRDAMQMLGIKNTNTFKQLSKNLGISD